MPLKSSMRPRFGILLMHLKISRFIEPPGVTPPGSRTKLTKELHACFY
jgi:hypothetical protein